MNYIQQLKADKKELQEIIKTKNEVLHELLQYLTSPKFQGIDTRDGTLNNYVNTNDVISRILPILRPINPTDDQVME